MVVDHKVRHFEQIFEEFSKTCISLEFVEPELLFRRGL